ncbi:phospholipase D-like domain-containing protein [Salinicoccus siamensis]|uniref:Phospholipase D-like domain-containing protein n=1 Tax=Salinicoccus siamensis TaxID=381830 RepID=A0ABV5Z4M1_9STAP
MSIDLMDKDFGSKFHIELSTTNETLRIMSPFISYKTASYLANCLKNKSMDCTIITRFNREEFLQGANSLEGIEALLKSGASVYALQHLHSKLYIFDDRSAILGSANFSMNGFFKNHELGIFVKEEEAFVGNIVEYANQLLDSIKYAGDFEVTQDRIDEEKKQISELISKRTSKSTDYKNTHRWGAIINQDENEREKKKIYGDNIMDPGF